MNRARIRTIRRGACDFALCAEGWNESRIPACFGRKAKGGLGRFPDYVQRGRWSENLPHRLELFHGVAQVQRTGCRIDSRRAGQALRRSSRKFEMRIP